MDIVKHIQTLSQLDKQGQQDFFDKAIPNVFINFHTYVKNKYTWSPLTNETLRKYEYDVHNFTKRCVQYGIIGQEFESQFIDFILSITDIQY